MPYMYCNHKGCNETVKLPKQYCTKHTPVKEDTKEPKTKKTTK